MTMQQCPRMEPVTVVKCVVDRLSVPSSVPKHQLRCRTLAPIGFALFQPYHPTVSRFRNFHVAPLGRVTLITGENNTGKSSILEAIRLLSQNAGSGTIYDILLNRSEFVSVRQRNHTSLILTRTFL